MGDQEVGTFGVTEKIARGTAEQGFLQTRMMVSPRDQEAGVAAFGGCQ